MGLSFFTFALEIKKILRHFKCSDSFNLVSTTVSAAMGFSRYLHSTLKMKIIIAHIKEKTVERQQCVFRSPIP